MEGEEKGSIIFFNDTATTEIYTLSLHDALPICSPGRSALGDRASAPYSSSEGCAAHRRRGGSRGSPRRSDRKSTRLNSSHANISYAVFCLKKKQSFHLSRAIPLLHSLPSFISHS